MLPNAAASAFTKSKGALASRRILRTDAPVLPTQMQLHWRDSAASTSRSPTRRCSCVDGPRLARENVACHRGKAASVSIVKGKSAAGRTVIRAALSPLRNGETAIALRVLGLVAPPAGAKGAQNPSMPLPCRGNPAWNIPLEWIAPIFERAPAFNLKN